LVSTLIREDGLVLMTGAEEVEWYQTHGFQVFDVIPFAMLLSAASCGGYV
jgi:hypothetical protein